MTLASLVTALSAEAALPAQAEEDKKAMEDGSLERGREALATAITNSACTDCHKFRDEGEVGSAPDLTGYGSREWLIGMIGRPALRLSQIALPGVPIRSRFGQAGRGRAPVAPRQHEHHADETELLGCVYIDPTDKPGADADISWWVVDECVGTDLETALDEFVPRWVAEVWPLERPRYVGRDLTWQEWLAIPRQP